MLLIKKSLSLILLLSCLSASADLVKWVDEKGNTHYGDRAPEGVTTQNIDTSRVSSMNSRANSDRARELNSSFDAERDLKKRDAARQAKLDAKKKKHQKYCDAVREDLRILRMKLPVYEKDKDGKQIYIDDAERKSEIAKDLAILKKQCS